MQIDSRQLAAFDAVLREGSFEAAARRLHVTPSAVSQRIKGLEERLGRVLVRRGLPCVATEAGEALQRHAQQLQMLEAEVLAPFGQGGAEPRSKAAAAAKRLPLAIAVNADSLATWFVPALAELHRAHDVGFDLVVEDQEHSGELLRQGRVMAAVSAEARPVQGCKVLPLGHMRYLAVASPAYMQRYFAGGVSASTLAAAPCNVFNRKDTLQARFIRQVVRQASSQRIEPPQHWVPSTHGFIHAAVQGLGWGMNPALLVAPLLASGELVELVPGESLQVALFWQHWRLASDVLGALTRAVRAAASAMLE